MNVSISYWKAVSYVEFAEPIISHHVVVLGMQFLEPLITFQINSYRRKLIECSCYSAVYAD